MTRLTMNMDIDELTQKNRIHHWLISTALLLACLPLWGNDPEISIDEAHSMFRVAGVPANEVHSMFRVVGVPTKEVISENWPEPLVLHSHKDGLTGVSISADGRIALSAGGLDQTMRLWDTATGKLLRTMKDQAGLVFGVSLSADGRIALSGSLDGVARLWDTATGKLLHTMEGHLFAVFGLSLSANGQLALSGGSMDQTVRLWDTTTGKLLHIMEGHEGIILGVSLSMDGRLALSGGHDETVRLWDTATGKLLRTMKGHVGWVNGVSLSADGRRALSGGDDETVRLWDTTTGKPLHTMKGHESSVLDVSLSADGRIALSGGSDGTVSLWDTTIGKPLHTMKGHEGPAHVSLSADGRLALSGSDIDGTVRLWRSPVIDPQLALRQAVKRHVKETMNVLVGPVIAKPNLPPVREYEKDPFENMAMFEERMVSARAERERQISDIQTRYRSAVEERNAKVRAFEKSENQLQRIRLTAHAKAVAEVFGHPVLKALRDENGNPKYESEARPPRMHIALQFEHTEDSEDWIFEVPLGEPARNLYNTLEAGEVAATTEYRLEDDVLSLVGVYAHHGGLQYKGIPAEQNRYSASQPLVRVLGQGDQLPLLKQQNPNLKDVAFIEYETQQRREFEDDIPSLFEKAEAVEIDSRKWLFVVGVEEYAETDNINYSRRSAEWFAKVATKVLGVSKGRQHILLDDEATGLAIKHRLEQMLDSVREGDHIYFYYSGHGIPVPSQDNAPYILPQDAIPDFVDVDDGYRVENIYRRLMQSSASQVIAFMDSCFTGQTDGVSVFKGEKAGTRLAPIQFTPPENGKLAVLTAGTEKQYSGAYGERGHRMFSYFVIKELLRGHDSIGALGKKVAADVTSTTMELGGRGKQQDPVLQGNHSLSL